jgi:hypothetical protein
LPRKVIAPAEAYRPDAILIEDVGSGMNLLWDLRHSMPAGLIRPLKVKPEGSKIERMGGATGEDRSRSGSRAHERSVA